MKKIEKNKKNYQNLKKMKSKFKINIYLLTIINQKNFKI